MNAVPHSHAELWETWEESWREFALEQGDMSHSTRELVALAISIVKQHEASIRLHVVCAREFGISAEQIFEVIPITLLMDGAPAMSQIPRVVDAVEVVFA
jgi:AhpD family alkylhydroperoxidase